MFLQQQLSSFTTSDRRHTEVASLSLSLSLCFLCLPNVAVVANGAADDDDDDQPRPALSSAEQLTEETGGCSSF